jgi:hypothetical protein
VKRKSPEPDSDRFGAEKDRDHLFFNRSFPGRMSATRSLDKFAGFDIFGANFDATDSTVFINYTDRLKIGVPPALGQAGNILTDTAFTFGFTTTNNTVANPGALTAILTYSGHDYLLAKTETTALGSIIEGLFEDDS